MAELDPESIGVADIKIVDTLLHDALSKRVSDIYIEPTPDSVSIRYRIDGIVHDIQAFPKGALAGIVSRIKILSNLSVDERQTPQHGRFLLESDDYTMTFEVSIFPLVDGEKIVMHVRNESGKEFMLDELGMSQTHEDALRKASMRSHGLILVTGPAGSGKTTTIYALMKELASVNRTIYTIEEAIQYRIPGITHLQTHPQIGRTFAHGITGGMRQDPDTIMVEEIRDTQTASLVMNAALKGHLMISSLHANSASGTMVRLRDMEIESSLFSSTYTLIVAQRLVRRLCDRCKIKIPFDAAVRQKLAEVVDIDHLLGLLPERSSEDAMFLYTASGCEHCRGGYRGQIGLYEFLEVTPDIQAASFRPSRDIEVTARQEQGMISILEDGVLKAIQGITSMEEVVRVAKE